jgi:hypothetical protein
VLKNFERLPLVLARLKSLLIRNRNNHFWASSFAQPKNALITPPPRLGRLGKHNICAADVRSNVRALARLCAILQVQVYKYKSSNFTSSISSILQCNFTSTIFQALLVQPQSKCQLLFLIGWFRIRKISALYMYVVVSMYYLEWQNPMYVCSACVRCELTTNICS